MIELLTCISLVLVLTAMTLPAIQSQSRSTSLNTGSQVFSNLLLQARSEAIARHTVVRFAVVKNWEGNEEANYRRIALWHWNHDSSDYEPLTGWEELPEGIELNAGNVDFIRTSTYAQHDASSVRGYFVVNKERGDANEREEWIDPTGKITMEFVEFLPNGSVRFDQGESRHGIFVLSALGQRERGAEQSQPNHWAQINVDSLTGRARVYQP